MIVLAEGDVLARFKGGRSGIVASWKAVRSVGEPSGFRITTAAPGTA
jgi:hypothetical protein